MASYEDGIALARSLNKSKGVPGGAVKPRRAHKKTKTINVADYKYDVGKALAAKFEADTPKPKRKYVRKANKPGTEQDKSVVAAVAKAVKTYTKPLTKKAVIESCYSYGGGYTKAPKKAEKPAKMDLTRTSEHSQTDPHFFDQRKEEYPSAVKRTEESKLTATARGVLAKVRAIETAVLTTTLGTARTGAKRNALIEINAELTWVHQQVLDHLPRTKS